MRTVIIHYHIYKNAGTSFDHVLTHNFGDRHELFDGPFHFFTIDQEQLDRLIIRRPDAVAFSSHQIMLPPPSSLNYRALTAIFVRNPFLRVASIYRFKRGPERDDGTPLALLPVEERVEILAARGQPVEMATQLDGTSTGILAQKMDFAAWLDHCLVSSSELPMLSNAQTRFFAAPYRTWPLHRRIRDVGMEYDLGTTLRNLAGVELLGRTEHFEADVTRFADILGGFDIPLSLPENTRHNSTSESGPSTEERVEALLSSLPPATRHSFELANQQDMALYDRACALIERDHRV